MLLGGLGLEKIALVLLIALLVLGPERLPEVAEQAGRNLRKLRLWLTTMTQDVKTELGPEIGDLDLRSLTPQGVPAPEPVRRPSRGPSCLPPGCDRAAPRRTRALGPRHHLTRALSAPGSR